MIGGVTDTFRNTPPAINQEFVGKSQMSATGSYTWKFDVNHVFSGYAI